jgi:hypothetical protein
MHYCRTCYLGHNGSLLGQQSGCHPFLNVLARPDPPGCELGFGGWKVRIAAHQFINPLTTDPYHLRDLGNADQLGHDPKLSSGQTVVNTYSCRSSDVSLTPLLGSDGQPHRRA